MLSYKTTSPRMFENVSVPNSPMELFSPLPFRRRLAVCEMGVLGSPRSVCPGSPLPLPFCRWLGAGRKPSGLQQLRGDNGGGGVWRRVDHRLEDRGPRVPDALIACRSSDQFSLYHLAPVSSALPAEACCIWFATPFTVDEATVGEGEAAQTRRQARGGVRTPLSLSRAQTVCRWEFRGPRLCWVSSTQLIVQRSGQLAFKQSSTLMMYFSFSAGLATISRIDSLPAAGSPWRWFLALRTLASSEGILIPKDPCSVGLDRLERGRCLINITGF